MLNFPLHKQTLYTVSILHYDSVLVCVMFVMKWSSVQ